MVSQAKRFIDSLAAKGDISFTTIQMKDALGVTIKAARRALERLKQQNEIASPAKGYYLIIPPQFRSLRCLPPNYFIDDLMSYWNREYYVALLSASMFYGAAHQQPQTCQVMVSDKRSDVVCGHVTLEFIQNKLCGKTPLRLLKTPTGTMKVSTPEATAMNMMKFIKQSGGMNRVLTVLAELTESMSEEDLTDLLKLLPEVTWIQRLGHLLDRLDCHNLAKPLHDRLSMIKTRTVPLVPYAPIVGVKYDKRWHVAVNIDLEGDLDDIY